jgi:hypothetical protein
VKRRRRRDFICFLEGDLERVEGLRVAGVAGWVGKGAGVEKDKKVEKRLSIFSFLDVSLEVSVDD